MDILFDIFKILGCVAGSLLLIVLIIAIIVAPFKARADKKGEKIPDMFEEFLETMSLDIPINDKETYKSIFQQ